MKRGLLLLFLVFFAFCNYAMEFTQEEYKTYCAARELADIVFKIEKKLNNKLKLKLKDVRKNMVHPSCSKTQVGIFLETYKGYPYRLWTPWGGWQFAKICRAKKGMDKVIWNCLAKHACIAQRPCYGIGRCRSEHGPLYAVTRVNKFILSEPRQVHPRWNVVYKQQEKWESMTKKHD